MTPTDSGSPLPRGQVLSVQVGPVRQQHRGDDTPYDTAFVKSAQAGPIAVTPTGLTGDAQADRKHHGGPDKALLAYASEHFATWAREWERDTIPGGGFGENLTLRGITEQQVCLGDVWQVGSCQLEVSQPRQPCWKLAERWNTPNLPKRVTQTGRSGWYLRVLVPGSLEAGDAIHCLERSLPAWTIERANRVFYSGSEEERRQLAAVGPLAQAWRDHLQKP